MTTYQHAIILVAQSLRIHPDWDHETHAEFLQSEGFDLDEMITFCAWPTGPKDYPLRAFVKTWVNCPDKCTQRASEIVQQVA